MSLTLRLAKIIKDKKPYLLHDTNMYNLVWFTKVIIRLVKVGTIVKAQGKLIDGKFL